MATASILDQVHPLAPETVAGFQRDGHCLVRGLLTGDDLRVYASALRAAAWRCNRETRPLQERDTAGKAFMQVQNLWRNDNTARRFTLARRFARIAAELMGVAAVRLYHDQAMFTESGGGITPWHQDQDFWPFAGRALTMWMALEDIPAEAGTLRFVPGSQRLGPCARLGISDESESWFARLIAERALPVVETGAMAAGDATFHDGWTIHGARDNASARVREAMTVIYVEDGARVAPSEHAEAADELARFLPGLSPGDAVASDLNPLLDSR